MSEIINTTTETAVPEQRSLPAHGEHLESGGAVQHDEVRSPCACGGGQNQGGAHRRANLCERRQHEGFLPRLHALPRGSEARARKSRRSPRSQSLLRESEGWGKFGKVLLA